MRITIDMVMACRPCYSRKKVEELAAGRESISAMEVAALPISIDDRAWLLSYLLGPRDKTREVARRIAREVLEGREIPAAFQRWSDSGDEDLLFDAYREADRGQYCHNANIAWQATRVNVGVAALGTAKAAARNNAWNTMSDTVTWLDVWVASMEKYTTWMAEWLDSHEEEYDDEDNG